MSIINSANPGSQINLLCMTYRTISRNNGKLSESDIFSLCRPEKLPTKPDHLKRFGDNFRFWMQDSHQLWKENIEAKLELVAVSTTDTPLAIAATTSRTLFSPEIEDIFGKDTHGTESLIRSLGVLLSSDSHSVASGQVLDNKKLEQIFSKFLPDYIPNDSEKRYVFAYGHFLGFLEPVPGGNYSVDPTRAVKFVLEAIFGSQDSLEAEAFFRRLSKHSPLLDGGRYRQQVEEKIAIELPNNFTNRKISNALSLALERLRFAGLINFESKSDDPSAYWLQLATGQKAISTVSFLIDRISK